MLTRMIQEQRGEIDGLKHRPFIFCSRKSSSTTIVVTEEIVSPNSVQCSYAAAAAQSGESVSEGNVGHVSNVNTPASSPGRLVAHYEKKFNVVIQV